MVKANKLSTDSEIHLSSARLSDGLANPIDVNTLWNQNSTSLYTMPDDRSGQSITFEELQELELVNEEGHKVAIYIVDGFYVNCCIIGFTPEDQET